MKGLLYGNFLLNKVWFISAAIIAVLGTVCSAVLRAIGGEASSYAAMALTAAELVVITVSIEWLARNLESNLKCRFADYALAGGISKNEFVLCELLKNLISIGFSFVLCVIMQLALSAFNINSLKVLFVMVIMIGAIEWICAPVVIDLKSAEKAGLLVGLILGFGIVMPGLVVFRAFCIPEDKGWLAGLIELADESWFVFAAVGVCAAIYALFYFILLKRVKKGDVC